MVKKDIVSDLKGRDEARTGLRSNHCSLRVKCVGFVYEVRFTGELSYSLI